MSTVRLMALLRFCFICALLQVFTSSSSALTNIVVNGSFEQSDSGWTHCPSCLAIIGGGGPPAGLRFAIVSGPVQQALPTVTSADYVLMFAHQGSIPSILWDGVAVTNGMNYGDFNAFWKYSFAHVHAVSNVSTLTFNSGAIDDVVVASVLDPIIVVSEPESRSAFEGAIVSFSVMADGPQELRYQWFFQGAPIEGANGRSFTIKPVQTFQAGSYSVIVSNSWNFSLSATAQLQVIPPPSAPELVFQPVGDTCPVGYAFNFSAFAVGAPPLHYQWNQDGVPISDATNASLTFATIQPTNAGTYTLLVTNQYGTVVSLPAILATTNAAGGGLITFNLYTNSAAITDVDGFTRLTGTVFRAQAYAGATSGIVRPVGAFVTFPAAGIFAGYPGAQNGFTRTIPDVPSGQDAYVQVRAWESAYGDSYEQARAAGGKYGFSGVYSARTGGGRRAVTQPFSLRAGEPFFRTGLLTVGDRLPDGTLQYVLTGEKSARYLVETKQPPNNWIPLLILTNIAGTSVFTDTNQTGDIHFYRARLLD